MTRWIQWAICVACVSAAIAGTAHANTRQEIMARQLQDALEARLEAPEPSAAAAATPCIGGTAAGFPCDKVDLLSQMTLADLGGADNGNDVWGWTDPQTGVEYALMGLSNGTAFVDVSDPENPVLIGNLPTHTQPSLWRDIKVFQDHAFVVAEAPAHGMQVFDLNQLRTVVSPPVTFSETAHYDGVSGSHNVVINEDTGFAYIVGATSCSGGLHMIDISTPSNPTFAGCFDSDGYTHDAQCVIYHGPDTNYQGREICFNANEDTITIVDVTDKSNPVQIVRAGYPNVGYVHQGWVTGDHKYFLQDDELDEFFLGVNTTTKIWDISDLANPVNIGDFVAPDAFIDHNQYTRGHLDYQANYRGGLRILDLSNISSGTLAEVAYFDTHPPDNNTNFGAGSWSVYPYFKSGNVLIGNYEGLLVVRPTINQAPLCDAGGPYSGALGTAVQFDASGSSDPDDGIAAYNWDFGDGAAGTGALASHTYAAVGDYLVRLSVTDNSGATSVCATTVTISGSTAVESTPVPTHQGMLHQNQPNPFNPSTRIAFELASPTQVTLRIYDARGAEVRTLADARLSAAAHVFEWDGRDAAGQEVASGAYFYQLETESEVLTRKMMLVK
jgi:choice-of-anchor B domain-containing protein